MTTHRLRSLAVTSLATASLFAAGCGGSEEDKVEDAVKNLAEAGKDKDFAGVCEGFAEDALKQIEDLGQGDCEKTLEKAGDAFTDEIPDPDDLKIEKVEVTGDKATAEIDGDEASFVKEDGDWKISRDE